MTHQKDDIRGNAAKEIPVVELVNEIWRTRRKSNLVKWFMNKSGVSMDEMASYLDCSKQYLNNKFSRDCFSVEDTMIAAYACDYKLAVVSSDGTVYALEPEEYLGSDEKTWQHIQELKEKNADLRRREYETKKAELERMRREYGFDD